MVWHFPGRITQCASVYGITRPVRTWNPIKINFQHVWLLIKDAWRTSNWKEKFTLWFRHTGYRPSDVAAKYPVYKIEDVYHFEKYNTKTSAALNVWSWIQLVMILLFVSYLFGNIAVINQLDKSYIFWYGGFIFSKCICFNGPDGQESICCHLGNYPERVWNSYSYSAG
ncbi:MAG: hypothetical protein WDO71_15435 [Bacteroidota bacterium]